MMDRLSLKQYHLIAVALFLAITALCNYRPSALLMSKVPCGYNEGWNAFHSNHLSQGESLYPHYDALISNNYPPLSFYLNSCLAMIIGDNVITGRIISLLSLLVVASMLGICAMEMGGRGTEAMVISSFFLASIAVFAGGYVGTADPQWLGHAAQLSGLYLLLKSRNKGWLFYLSIFIMVVSGFVKHSLIAMPLAVFLWLLVNDRAAFVRFLTVGLLVVCSFLLVFTMIHGLDFLRGLFLDCRAWKPYLFVSLIDYRFSKLMVFLMLGVLGFVLLPKSETSILLLLYFLLASLWGAYISGGIGVDWNALFDVVIASTLVGGAFLRHADRIECQNALKVRILSIAILLVFAVALAVPLPHQIVKARQFWKTRELQIETAAGDIRYLSDIHGPAMCEDLSLCYWAGKRFEVDYFSTGQKIRAGVIERQELTELIESRFFSVIQIEHSSGESSRFDAMVNRTISENYCIDRRSQYAGVFLIPK
jgi:hypothetical protein